MAITIAEFKRKQRSNPQSYHFNKWMVGFSVDLSRTYPQRDIVHSYNHSGDPFGILWLLTSYHKHFPFLMQFCFWSHLMASYGDCMLVLMGDGPGHSPWWGWGTGVLFTAKINLRWTNLIKNIYQKPKVIAILDSGI